MRTSFSLPTPKLSWSSDDVRILRELAGKGLRVALIAKRMRRSESAIRNKAAMHGVALRASGDGDGGQTELEQNRGQCSEGLCAAPGSCAESVP
jgi:hypothetical protein